MTRSNIVGMNITSESESAQIALIVDTEKNVTIFVRTAPTDIAPAPRWTNGVIPSNLWPKSSSSAKQGAIATIQGFIKRKISDDGPDITWTIGGVWEIEVTEKDNSDFDAGTAQPANLFTRVRTALAEEPPRTVVKDNLIEVAGWIVEGPLVALDSGDLSKFTQPQLKKMSLNTSGLSEDERLAPIQLDEKRVFLPRMTKYGVTDVEILETCYENNIAILLTGEPGTGKSSVAEAVFGPICSAKGLDFRQDALMVMSEGTTTADLQGDFRPLPDGTYEVVLAKVVKCMLAGIPMLLDEALLADPKVLTPLYSILDGRNVMDVPASLGLGGTVTAADGFYMAFAGNRNAPGAILSEALESRTLLRPEYTSDFDLALKIMGEEHGDIITVARNMELKRWNGEVGQSFQLRDLIEGYLKIHDVFDAKMALSNLLTIFKSDADREVAEDLIKRGMGVQSVEPFRI